jgi:hypothetical protein
MTEAMNTPRIPTPEAGDTPTPGDEIPSFSPSARESASKRRERTAACDGETLTPGDEVPSQTLAFASCAPVTADVTESPKGGAESDRPVEDPMPRWLRRWIDQGLPRAAEVFVPLPNAHFVPSILRRPENADLLRGAGVVTPLVTPSPTVAPAIGSICPTCRCRVPARLNAAERQRAYRERKREQGKLVP